MNVQILKPMFALPKENTTSLAKHYIRQGSTRKEAFKRAKQTSKFIRQMDKIYLGHKNERTN